MRLPLDQNFPEPILGQLKPWMGDIQLLPLRTIDEELTQLDDRDLLIALKQLEFEGLVTLNYKMLRNPKELAAVLKTKLNIFAVEGVGHDPIRATGALLLDLQPAVNAIESGRTGVFWLRPRSPQPQDPWELLRAQQRTTARMHLSSTSRSRFPTLTSRPTFFDPRCSTTR